MCRLPLSIILGAAQRRVVRIHGAADGSGDRLRHRDVRALRRGTPEGAQDGVYQVRDTMNKRHTEWIDILLTPGDKSFYYRNVLMYKIDSNLDLDVIKDIYDQYPDEQPQPIAMVAPEVRL